MLVSKVTSGIAPKNSPRDESLKAQEHQEHEISEIRSFLLPVGVHYDKFVIYECKAKITAS